MGLFLDFSERMETYFSTNPRTLFPLKEKAHARHVSLNRITPLSVKIGENEIEDGFFFYFYFFFIKRHRKFFPQFFWNEYITKT